MKKFKFLIISTIVLIAGVITLSIFITSKLDDYKVKQMYAAEQLNFENRIMNAWEWLPFTNVGDEMVATWQDLEVRSMKDYNTALIYSGILAIWVLVYALLNVAVYRKSEVNYRAFGYISVFAALSFLYLGLTAPLMEMMVYSSDLTFEVPISGVTGDDFFGLGFDMTDYNLDRALDGRTYYFYQNKSILGLIFILYMGGNFLIAIVLLVASVIFPLTKLIMSLVVLNGPQKKGSLSIFRMIRNLGKWSMIDVFVVSIFLGYFSYANMEAGVDTGASTLAGTYFFLIFITISISSGKYLKKALKKSQDVAEWVLE